MRRDDEEEGKGGLEIYNTCVKLVCLDVEKVQRSLEVSPDSQTTEETEPRK